MPKRLRSDGLPEYEGLWWKFALPQVILCAHLAIVSVLVWDAARRDTGHLARQWADLVLGLAAGWILWTLFEYVFHRWLLHHTRTFIMRRLFWDALHREHHGYREMLDHDHHGVHVAISLPIMAMISFAVARGFEGALPLALTAGWLSGYCAYEALHWLFHAAPQGHPLYAFPPFEHLRRAHTVHHLRHAGRNFGFVTQVWDRSFGTYLEGTD